jgi:hypothetical protein
MGIFDFLKKDKKENKESEKKDLQDGLELPKLPELPNKKTKLEELNSNNKKLEFPDIAKKEDNVSNKIDELSLKNISEEKKDSSNDDLKFDKVIKKESIPQEEKNSQMVSSTMGKNVFYNKDKELFLKQNSYYSFLEEISEINKNAQDLENAININEKMQEGTLLNYDLFQENIEEMNRNLLIVDAKIFE